MTPTARFWLYEMTWMLPATIVLLPFLIAFLLFISDSPSEPY